MLSDNLSNLNKRMGEEREEGAGKLRVQSIQILQQTNKQTRITKQMLNNPEWQDESSLMTQASSNTMQSAESRHPHTFPTQPTPAHGQLHLPEYQSLHHPPCPYPRIQPVGEEAARSANIAVGTVIEYNGNGEGGMQQLGALVHKMQGICSKWPLETVGHDLRDLHQCIQTCSKIIHKMAQPSKPEQPQGDSEPIVLIYEIPVEIQVKEELQSGLDWTDLEGELAGLKAENASLRAQVRALQQQMQDQEIRIVNNLYELPVQLYIQPETETGIGNGEEQKEANWQQSESKFVNFSFTHALPDGQKREEETNLESPSTPAFSPHEYREWTCINTIYQIPVQLIVQSEDPYCQKCDEACQANNLRTCLRLVSRTVEYANCEVAADAREESMSLITKEMQLLLQSEEMPDKNDQGQNQDCKESRESDKYEITYKAEVKNSQNKDDMERESVLFVELSGLVEPPAKSHQFLSPILKESNQPITRQAHEEESNGGNDENSHSMEPSLINGISMIKKRQEHSQSQSNSQINDYLQAYQKYESNHNGHTNESYESKNGVINCDGMNNCNHCGVSVKTAPKGRGFSNRSLGSNIHSPSGYYTSNIENIIEERYSEESKSKRTTLKNFNGTNGSPDHVIEDEEDFMNLERRPRVRKEKMKWLLTDKRKDNAIKEEERQLELGQNLFLQKSLVIEPNKIEEADKKKAKQRLSEHPYLNFYETSEMEQVSQAKGPSKENSRVLQDISREEKSKKAKEAGKSSFEQTSIMLNFNAVDGLGNESKESFKLHQIGIIQAAGTNMKGHMGGKNPVYLIDGDTSSEGSRANREMKISQMKNEISKQDLSEDRKEQGTPMHYSRLKENAVDATEFYQLKEKTVHLEEEKSILLHKLNESQLKAQFLRKEVLNQQESLCEMEQKYKDKLTALLEQLESYDEKLQLLEKELEEKANRIEEETKRNEEKDRRLEESERVARRNERENRQLSETLKMMETNLEMANRKTMKDSVEKEQMLDELRAENVNLKEEYEVQSRVLKEQLAEREERIQMYLRELEKSQETIDHLKSEHMEIMGSLEAACREKEEYLMQLQSSVLEQVPRWDKFDNIYETEFVKCKEQHAKELEGRDRKVAQLQTEVLHLATLVKEKDAALKKLEDSIRRKQFKIVELEQEIKNSKKLEISCEIQEELNYLRKELVSSAKEIEYKQELINKLENGLKNRVDEISEFHQGMGTPRKGTRARSASQERLRKRQSISKRLLDESEVEEGQIALPLHLHTAQSIVTPTNPAIPLSQDQLKQKQERILELTVTVRSFESSMESLEKVILNYEDMLLRNQNLIAQLQGQVGEYLQDAIEKERENESLLREVEDYEAEINQILREKIGVEIENKRMKKMIAASEKRISAIGTRLIHAAKDKIKGREQSSIPGSQNSTLKIRELRLQ